MSSPNQKSGMEGFLADWNAYSTVLAVGLVTALAYKASTAGQHPEIHPVRLERQAIRSQTRHEGESPVYRPLTYDTHGLVKGFRLPREAPPTSDSSGPAYLEKFHNGDLRDIWRKVVAGNGAQVQEVFGLRVTTCEVASLDRQIHRLGHFLARLPQQHSAEEASGWRERRVAIYLPNSPESLVSLFACALYTTLTPILVPGYVSQADLISCLHLSEADVLISRPGVLSLDEVIRQHNRLRSVVWVVEGDNPMMDWTYVPEGSQAEAITWGEVMADSVDEDAIRVSQQPVWMDQATPKDVVTFWEEPGRATMEMISFTHGHLTAAVASHLHVQPKDQALTSTDVILSAEDISFPFALTVVLAGLYVGATVCMNSVCGPPAPVENATRGVSATVLVVSATKLAVAHHELMQRKVTPSFLQRMSLWWRKNTLVHHGRLPGSSSSSLLLPLSGRPGSVRLILCTERVCQRIQPEALAGHTPAKPSNPPVSPLQPDDYTGATLSWRDLSDLRALTGARVVHTLTASQVAGAVTQAMYSDFRDCSLSGTDLATSGAAFGGPTASTEIFLRDVEGIVDGKGGRKQPQDYTGPLPAGYTVAEVATTDEGDGDVREGEIVVRGPSVVGGEASLGCIGRIRPDYTLELL